MQDNQPSVSHFDSVSRVSINTASIDIPNMQINGPTLETKEVEFPVINEDKDLLEEHRFKQWQDISPDPTTCFEPIENSQPAKFIKLNIYRLYDFGTLAQYDLSR